MRIGQPESNNQLRGFSKLTTQPNIYKLIYGHKHCDNIIQSHRSRDTEIVLLADHVQLGLFPEMTCSVPKFLRSQLERGKEVFLINESRGGESICRLSRNRCIKQDYCRRKMLTKEVI